MQFSTRLGGAATDSLPDVLGQFQSELEQELTMAIGPKHAPIMIPRTTIDAAHSEIMLAAANAVAQWAQQYWTNTFSTTSASFVTAIEHVGRGTLLRAVVAEVTSAAAAAYSGQVRITIDGKVLYSNIAAITRQSSMHVIVGQLDGLNVVISDDAGNHSYNSSCKIEVGSDGVKTTTVGWKLAKKL